MALGSGNIQIRVGAQGLTDDIVRQVRTAEKKIRPMSVSLNEKGFRQPLGRISGDLAEFQKSLDASVARTLAFGAAVGVLNAVSQGFKAMIASAVEVEKSLTDINVILNLNSNALADFSSKLFDTAKNTGQSFQTVSEAAVELSRQGLGAEETLGRINDAMILTRLSGMEAAKSVETLTAAVNSFGDTAITTTEIVNKLATVDAAFAVSTEDLANGLARAGATAQSAKVDLNELLAAVTSVQQTTARGGAVIGNAFKSIFTRLQRGGVREALEEIGVATTDAAGNIRGALDILKDYSSVYGTLTDSQQAFTDELIAGVFQINNLKALIKDLGSDYSIYERALNQSNNATDEAVRRNEKLQGTLSTLINEATVNAKELAATLGDLIATPAIENLLNLFNSISGALSQALDPEKGSKLMQGMFKAIGDFIAGPGLILVGVAFVKLFKFITGQSLKALKEIFKIGSATNKIAETEAKIGFLLKNNKNLYEAISNSALNHEQKEELVLQTIKQQNAAYLQQQKLISRISSSRAINAAVNITNNASGFVPARAKGYVPNFTNQIEGAINSERAAISTGEGGASRSAKPKVLKNFPVGGGRKQTIVANTDEVIVPNFGGSTGSAIFNKDMIKKSGGVPEGAIAVANGHIPNFASSLEKNKDYGKFLMSREGLQIDAERDLGGFGMVSAKGIRGKASSTLKRISGFSPAENESIINKISGSRLTKEDKKYISKIIARKKTSFSNIGTSSITEMSSPEVSKKVEGKAGAINDLIQPSIANAVASVASRIYNGILGDEVGAGLVNKVRKQADVDKSIVSTGVEGGIFESALRLGSLESAKSLGRDSSEAIWDFEEGSRITQDMRDIFFQGYGIVKGDAKRSGGAESLREVVEKSHKSFFKKPLEDIYTRHWAPFFEAGNKMTEGERSKGKRSGSGLNKAGGFIPNFVELFEGSNGIPSQAMSFQPLNKVGKNESKTIKQLSKKNRLSNAKIGSKNQKADLVDSFNATIVPEYQRFKDSQFRKWANGFSNNSIKSDSYANRLFLGKTNLLEKYGADKSAVHSLRTSLSRIRDHKKAEKEFKNQKKFKNFENFVKKKPEYKDLISKQTGAVAKAKDLKDNFENRMKGTIGEITAAKKEKTTINSGNSFFDLANGKEVKTVKGKQKASDILRKGANGWLRNKNIFNKVKDNISMGEIGVVLPRDTVLAASGFIPNFAEGLIDSPFRKGASRQNDSYANGYIPNFADALEGAIAREKEALSSQGSNAKIYVDKDSRLRGSKNPMGLLVANTRDEPLSGSQGVDRAISTGLNPKNQGRAASVGYIPNYISGGALAQNNFAAPQLKVMAQQTQKLANQARNASQALSDQADSSEGLSGSSDGLLGKIFALEFALSTLGSAMDISATGTQSSIAGLTGLSAVFPDLIGKLGLGGKALAGLTVAAGVAYDVYRNLYDPQLNNIKALESEIATREKSINIISQNIESLDKFATSAAKFGSAADKGDIEASGKILQNIFEQAKDIRSLNPEAFSDLIKSIGDTDKFNESVQNFKNLASQGKNLKTFSNDFAGVVKKFNEELDSQQFLGIFDIGAKGVDIGKFGDEIESMSAILTAGLPDEKIKKISDSLKDFNPSANSASSALLGLQDIIGEFDGPTRNWISNNESLAQSVIEQVRASTNYSSAVIAAKEAFQKAQNPVVALNKKINDLSLALEIAGESSDRAFNALYKISQIEIKSRSEGMQAAGTVTPENSIKGTSAAKIQNDLLKAAQETKTELRSFASNLIKENKESGAVLKGSLKTLIEGIKGGNVSSETALKALIQVQKTGSPDQKKIATETLQKLRNINATQIANQKIEEANARAQLNALKNQQIATLRNTQFSEQQVNALRNFDKNFNDDGTAKSSLQKITEMNNAIATLVSIGADEEILAELTEINAQTSELENLKATFSAITGKDIQARSLEELKVEIGKFSQKGGVGDLSADRAKFFTSLRETLRDALARQAESGVKTADQVKESQLIEIDAGSIDSLSSKMAQVIGEGISSALNIGTEVAEAVNKGLSVNTLSRDIQDLSSKNAQNHEKNVSHQQELNKALVDALKDSNFSGSADSLSKAASALERAVEKITIAPKGGAASGFVPSFSSSGEGVSRAIKTERALGGKPVVDYNKQVGTYVRDGNTQPNFSAVKRDHPEGIKKATSNSKTIQGYSRAGGFVPNFIDPLSLFKDGDQSEILKDAYFGKKPFVESSKLRSVYQDSSGVAFNADFMEKAIARGSDYTTWNQAHPIIIEKINNKNLDSFRDLVMGENNWSRFLEYSNKDPEGDETMFRAFQDINLGLGSDSISTWLNSFDRFAASGAFRNNAPNSHFVDSIGTAYQSLGKRQINSFNLGDVSKKALGTGALRTAVLKQGEALFASHEITSDEYGKIALVGATENLKEGVRTFGIFDQSSIQGENYLSQLNGGPEFITNSILQKKIFDAIKINGEFKLPLSVEKGVRRSGKVGLKYNEATSMWSERSLEETNSIVEKIISENNKTIGTQRAYKNLESELTKETLEEQGTDFNPLLLNDAEEENAYYSELKNKINNFKTWNSNAVKSDLIPYVSADGNIVQPEGGDPKLRPYSNLIDDISMGGYAPVDLAKNFVSQALTGVVSSKAREVNSKFIEGYFPENIQEAAQNILPNGAVGGALEKAQSVLKERQDQLSSAIEEKKGKGGNVDALEAQAKQLEEKQIQLEDAKAAAAEKLAGAEAAAKKVKEEAVKKEQTDLQKERNLLYLGLLGKQAQETREGLPALQVQERINKVQNVLGEYPPYIDNLIKPRKRRAAEAAKLSEKFNGSGDPRDKKYKKIQNKNESIINLLEERKRIYQSPEGLAHFYYQDASKLSQVEGERVGASIWDTDPNYLQRFNDLKKRYAIGEVGAEKQLAGKGIESRDILEKYPQYKGNELANIFAQIQEQEGNRPSAFSEKFKASGPQERIQLMQSIGAQSADPDEIKGFFKGGGPIETLKKINALSSQSSEPEMSFLLTEMLASKDNDVAKEAILGKIKSMGLPFMATEPVGGFLQSQKIDVLGAGGVNSKVNAVDPASISDLISFMTDTQIEDYIDANKARLEGEGIADSPKLIDLITGKKQSLLDFPVYLNHRADMHPDFLTQLVESKLKNAASVNNLASWEEKYQRKTGINKLSEKNLPNDYNGFYGNYIPSEFAKQPDPNLAPNKPIFLLEGGQEINPFEQFGNRRTSPSAAARKVIESFNHGTNKDFEDLLSNNKHPFPELGVPVGDRLEQFKSRAYAVAKQVKQLKYAPAGYEKEYQKDSPTGKPSMMASLFDAYIRVKPEDEEEGNNKARGFVPNFSAVAGEIAASRMAGYKSTVSPSQVKTMNIPGQGKTAYNTQESVFKLPGMSQPFIAPPSSSKAAKPYKKQVQKKFNFNPYGKTSADGFIPNFAGGMDSAAFEKSMKSFSSSVSGFERYVSNFDRAVSSLDFKEFAASSKQIFDSAKEFSNQSNTIKQAAALFNEGSNKISQSQPTASVDLSPMTSAASTITKGLNQLSDELGKPIQIDSSAITASMSQLTSALGNVKGSVDLNIPQVNVAVNGVSAISSSIASTIKSQIPGIVAESINSQKQAIIDEVKRSIFG